MGGIKKTEIRKYFIKLKSSPFEGSFLIALPNLEHPA